MYFQPVQTGFLLLFLLMSPFPLELNIQEERRADVNCAARIVKYSTKVLPTLLPPGEERKEQPKCKQGKRADMAERIMNVANIIRQPVTVVLLTYCMQKPKGKENCIQTPNTFGE